MSRELSSRSLLWDIVKGISIVAIVMGHTGMRGTAFVYLWHLSIFFFATGYFFDEKKYASDPFAYVGKRLKGSWPRFVLYSAAIILMHNWLVSHGLIANVPFYDHTAMATSGLNAITLNISEQLQGALWFVPVWIISSGLFAGCVWTGFPFAASLLCGILGSILMLRHVGACYNASIAFAVVPFYYAAWMTRRKVTDLKRCTPWYGWILSGVLLYLINEKLHIFFDLVSYNVHGFWFYPITLLGIYHCLCLAGLIDCTEKVQPLAQAIAFVGRHSFDIMALHFLVFKLIDFAYARYVLGQGPEGLAGFPIAFTNLRPVYLVFGVLVPLGVGVAVDAASKMIKRDGGSVSKRFHL